MYNVLLICGGGGTEHEISLLSADYIASKIDSSQFNVIKVVINKDSKWLMDEQNCELNFKKTLISKSQKLKIDVAIPCLHGYPGETGDIQSYFELIKLPYLGCSPESNLICFNKLITKLLLDKSDVPTTPYIQLITQEQIDRAQSFLEEHQSIYIKATNQGSSVGCYHFTIDKKSDLAKTIQEAFKYSNYLILEKEIKGRELEMAAFEFNGEVHITKPGEIVCEKDFYDYHAKYSKDSNTQTLIEAPNVSRKSLGEMFRFAKIIFETLKLKDLSRIDFFLTENDEIFINEVNTFPGHTSISMFPSMMENYGVSYQDYINQRLHQLVV